MNSDGSSIHIGVNTLFLIPGEVGGSQTYFCQTLDAICRNHEQFRITLFTNLENHIYLQSLFDKYRQVHFSNLNFKATHRYVRIVREQIELPFKVKQAGVDVLWSPGCTAPAISHCPQVLTIHDMQYKRHPEDLSQMARVTTEVLIKIACFRVHRFLTISEFSKSEIMRFTGIPEYKIAVSHLASDNFAQEFRPNSTIGKGVSKWIPENQKYILTIANSYPHKNLHTLIDAFGQIASQIPHQLVVIGKPRLGEPMVKNSLANLSDKDRVTRISGLTREKLIDVYRCADLFVFPSLYEGFGLPVLEAMMCLVPVVTTKKGSIPEVGGDFAIYVPQPTKQAFAETILRVLSWSLDYRCEFTGNARKWAESFSWKKTADQTIEILRSTAERSKN